MPGDLVLLTGSTGHLGFRTLVFALEAGYRVRAAVRNQANVEKVLSAPSIKSLNPGSNLEFVFVPDIIADGAYDDAVKGAKYIIHCASPLTYGITEDFENKVVIPAVKGTTGILNSAYKSDSVKRVVITSSVLGATPLKELFSQSGAVFDGDLKVPFNPGPLSSEGEAYCDSKVRALAATYDFLETKKPPFDIISLMPSYIIGKNELITDVADFSKGTNKNVFNQVLGLHMNPLPGVTVWLDDVAHLHVQALDPRIPGNQNYLATSGGLDGTTYSDALKIVAEKFPDEVKKGILPNNGTQPSVKMAYDTRKTEQAFGITFSGIERQVTDVAAHYLELVQKS